MNGTGGVDLERWERWLLFAAASVATLGVVPIYAVIVWLLSRLGQGEARPLSYRQRRRLRHS